jgi:S-adenosylmethionine synthetase
MSRSRTIFFTSESVGKGHPDKMADQISDGVLDSILEQDPRGRCACETLITRGLIIIAGEITTGGYVNFRDVVTRIVKKAGYIHSEYFFDFESCGIIASIQEQSADIARGVNESSAHMQGAGDQGIMGGYACKETAECMPLPIMLAHALVRRIDDVREKNVLAFLRPDSKSMVTVGYDGKKPICVKRVVIAAQHDPAISGKTDEQSVMKIVQEGIMEEVVKKVIPPEYAGKDMQVFINNTGRFVIGGPIADTGLTGRKIVVDTYGGKGSHGGGCFSGKDPTKVDRSAAYLARYITKNIVAADLADECGIQLSYVIGGAEPVSITIDTMGTGKIPDNRLEEIAKEVFDFRPGVIIQTLNLLRPIYINTAVYGHFGRSNDLDIFTWEQTDKVKTLQDLAGK